MGLELTFTTSRGLIGYFLPPGGMRPLTVVSSVPVAYNFGICGTVQCKVHFTTNLAPVFTVGTATMMAVAVRGPACLQFTSTESKFATSITGVAFYKRIN